MKILISAALILAAAGCTSLFLTPADFSWPVEDVLKIDGAGNATQERYSMIFNVKQLFQKEFADSNAAAGKEVRIIRDKSGYYYVTGKGFKNVYQFYAEEDGLKENDSFSTGDSVALASPVMNQKPGGIELLDGSKKYLLNKKGIARVK